jgi:G:T/U-mismatch repair DNA glycosylase
VIRPDLHLLQQLLDQTYGENNVAGNLNINEFLADQGLLNQLVDDSTEVINQSIDQINPNRRLLTQIPPYEKHPYYMEFASHARVAVIGTMPPISYLCDALEIQGLIPPFGRVIKAPKLSWFHGNRLSFWKLCHPILEDLINQQELERNQLRTEIENFMSENYIHYFDVIKYCQRRAYNAADNGLVNIIPNENSINQVLDPGSKIEVMFFTNGSPFTNLGLNIDHNNHVNIDLNPKSFDVFLEVLICMNQYEIELGLPNDVFDPSPEHADWFVLNHPNASHFCNKVAFYIKINERTFKVVTAASPSNVLGNILLQNGVFQRWSELIHDDGHNHIKEEWENHDNMDNDVLSFKKFIYETALFGNADLLFQLNMP